LPQEVAGAVTLSTPVSPHFQFRTFTFADIRHLIARADHDRFGVTSIGVPDPYSTDFARMWSSSAAAGEGAHALHWAACNCGDDQPVGYAGLNQIDVERRQAELRIWVGSGEARWRDAAEWSAAVLRFALACLRLRRVYAVQIARHALAGRVLASIGMRRDGLLRRRIHKEGLLEELVCWTIINEQCPPAAPAARQCQARGSEDFRGVSN
jgi:RimJ/RimL family protein N-acetyltransferase